MMRSSRVEAQALKALEAAGVKKIPVDPTAVAQFHGVVVWETDDLPDNISGLMQRDDGEPVIVVNRDHKPQRRRFTVAHELGHALLHDDNFIVDKTARVRLRDKESSLAIHTEEIEANAFAAELLMPRHHVVKQVTRAMKSNKNVTEPGLIRDLAGRFDVSEQAMGFRLVNLGFISSF